MSISKILLVLLALAMPVNAIAQLGSMNDSERYYSSSAEGFTEPSKTILLASPESGVIHFLGAREGDTVRTGDIICQLDTSVLKASLKAAELKAGSVGKRNAAKSSLRNKEHLYQQMQKLLEREHASEKEVLQARLEFDLAAANLKSANEELQLHQAEVDRIQAQIQRRIVRSPADSVILELPRQLGEAVTTAENQVATLVCLQQLRVRYFLSTQQASQLKLGSQIEVSFPEQNQLAMATVDFVAPVTDSKSGTVRVELLVENQQGQYRSGLRCVLNQATTSVAAEDEQGKFNIDRR